MNDDPTTDQPTSAEAPESSPLTRTRTRRLTRSVRASKATDDSEVSAADDRSPPTADDADDGDVGGHEEPSQPDDDGGVATVSTNDGEASPRRRSRSRGRRGGRRRSAASRSAADEDRDPAGYAGGADEGEPPGDPSAAEPSDQEAEETLAGEPDSNGETPSGDDAPPREGEHSDHETTTVTRRRTRSRGGRGRGKARSARAADTEDAPTICTSDTSNISDTSEPESPGQAGQDETSEDDDAGDQSIDGTAKTATAKTAKDAERSSPTRLQARSRGRRGGGKGGKAKGNRRLVGAVSDETRFAINEGPPRRMLVTEGAERTQIAVLEQRNLMEHYVTRRADVSYVGNIYSGRVQNVLPGMEAAFIDIGKGRNGVLYAGEVNYDEADRDGDLPRIEEQLKPGQTVLVQVTKDPMGTKGARLTQQLSIAGRYCVLAPADDMMGISRKLPDDERDRLRTILKGAKPQGYGLIVRTAAEGATAEQLEADVARLTRIWNGISARAEKAKALESVYTEPNLVIRVIRDIFGPEYTDLIVDSAELADEIKAYLGDVSPDMVDKVSVHTGDDKLFDAYEVATQIRRGLEKKVWLRSGGYLIIEKTEAMWVIDVNTGKFVGKDNLEETVLANNLEAAQEIAHQLRLRDMGGIIVIDFVDMMVLSNRDEVLKRFKRELARDKTKSRVMDISRLGLVQMTRKNVSQGLTETFTQVCETCEGRGATIADDFT